MASSSSAKKVARVAAKSGSGRQTEAKANKGRNWLFALAIVAIIGVGIGIVALARSTNEGLGANDTPPKANLQNGEPYDHWHAAFAINVCGTELQPLQDGVNDPLGIHTHGDGLAHIHPFTRTAAGKRATLAKYWKQVGLTVTDEGFTLPDGLTMEGDTSTVKEGETTCGGKEGELVLAHWKDARTAANTKPDTIYRENFGDIRFAEDLGAYTLAFVPKGSTDIPAPSAAANIDQLGQADAGTASPDTGADPGTTPAEDPATTVATGG